MNRDILDRIKQARKGKGYTQAYVAECLEISRPSYIKFEEGGRELTLKQAETLSSLLGVSVFESPEETQAKINRFKNMILAFVCTGGGADGRITKTKLAKMLYFADAQTYMNRNQTMSGMVYRRMPQGPVPFEFFQCIDEMADTKVLDIKFSGLAQMIGCVEDVELADLGFENNEIALITDIAEKWKHKRTDAIVNYSHEHPTWLKAEEYEPVDMSLLRSFNQPIY